jgi:ABC-type sugar transport system ATPase subunit
MIQQNPTTNLPTIELRGVTKAYPGVIALQDINLAIFPGEVHAVVGLNGAGKSTLVKILAGALQPDSGAIISRGGPAGALIANLVPQDVVVVPDFSIGRNILLGREHRFPVRQRLDRGEKVLVSEALHRVGVDLDPETSPAGCTTQELRLVQVAKALVEPGDAVLLDEPTAVLPEEDAGRLLRTLRGLRDEGEAVVYVSHRLGEVLEIADRITVLRDGRKVAEVVRGQVGREELLDLLTKGVEVGFSDSETAGLGEELLEVRDLVAPGCSPVNLVARSGQVIALVGVQAAGQSSVVGALAGVLPTDAGTVRLRGREVDISNLAAATKAGVMLVPADRLSKGIVGSMDIVENVALSPRSRASRGGIRRRTEERRVAASYVDRFRVKTPSIGTDVAVLSGGNQQKVSLARAIEARPKVLLLDEPTQGIDVATKWDILARIRDEARTGGFPVIAATSELEEIPGWADRALVFRRGAVVAHLDGDQITEERLLQLAV